MVLVTHEHRKDLHRYITSCHITAPGGATLPVTVGGSEYNRITSLIENNYNVSLAQAISPLGYKYEYSTALVRYRQACYDFVSRITGTSTPPSTFTSSSIYYPPFAKMDYTVQQQRSMDCEDFDIRFYYAEMSQLDRIVEVLNNQNKYQGHAAIVVDRLGNYSPMTNKSPSGDMVKYIVIMLPETTRGANAPLSGPKLTYLDFVIVAADLSNAGLTADEVVAADTDDYSYLSDISNNPEILDHIISIPGLIENLRSRYIFIKSKDTYALADGKVQGLTGRRYMTSPKLSRLVLAVDQTDHISKLTRWNGT